VLTVDDFAQIRQAKREGMSIREIARRFHHSRQTVRKALAEPEPPGYTLKKPRPAPKLGPFQAVIDRILAEDAEAPPKQRHTSMQVYRRLCAPEHGYTGGYDQVRRYVGRRREAARQTFVPLAHEPGYRLEADFGHIHVDFPEGRRQVPVLLTTWSYSQAKFALATPSERTEAILAGLVAALGFFEAVPRELWWDNPKAVASQILKGRARQLHPRYAALVSHYALAAKFCMPGSGWEKPAAENSVYDLQRRWATPVPRAQDLDELNAYLRRCCERELDRTCQRQSETIGARLAHDRAAAGALPAYPFDPCVLAPAKVDKYQTARFDRNRYSVPRTAAFQTVTVKGYIDRVQVVMGERVIAEHARSYGRGELILDPLHYLVTLGRRPAALDHAPVYRDWRLPAVFDGLREQLEQKLGPSAGARQFVRVLQLLAEHPVQRVQRAIEQCQPAPDADRIIHRTHRLAQREASGAACSDSEAAACDPSVHVQVPLPELDRFNQLLDSGASDHEQDAHPQPRHAGP
jgi:transposase